MFIDRMPELSKLKERYYGGKAEFIIVYGRRRVGKSELINQLLMTTKGVRLLAHEESKKMQLRRFSKELASFFNDKVLELNPFTNWDAFFQYIYEKTLNERIIIAIDEFSYLIKEDRSLPSLIQHFWDVKLRKTKLYLILCGSSISMMEKLMSSKSPVYGRRTGQLLIKPFKFMDLIKYYRDIRKCVEHYAVFGGIPAYILSLNPRKTLRKNILDTLLREDHFMFRDVIFILREEFDEPRYYFSIIQAIAKGNTRIGRIMNETGLNKGIVTKYLSVLMDLHIIKREVPITENPLKSRRGVYKLFDNLIDFWFRFIYPNNKSIEDGKGEQVYESVIKRFLSEHVGIKFEGICQEILQRVTPINLTKIGKWWYKNKEIDIVGINEETKEILFCECKWKDNVNAEKVMKGLFEKSKCVNWFNEKRKESFALFAKSFRKKITLFEGRKVYCYDLKDLKKILSSC